MTQQIQELINKIKQEGIQEADNKAQEIEEQAKTQAQKIIDEANNYTQDLIIQAKKEIRQIQDSTHAALKQASRDMLLSLRMEVVNVLQKIVKQEVSDALDVGTLSKIIEQIINEYTKGSREDFDIRVALSPDDLQMLKDSMIAKLQNQLKRQISFSSNEDITKGFTISFDGGKSEFDFSNQSLAEYLGRFVNSQVSSLLREVVQSKDSSDE